MQQEQRVPSSGGRASRNQGRANQSGRPGPRVQGIFWLLTVPQANYVPYPHPELTWIRGQLERGEEDGYLHWQLCCAFSRKKTLGQVRDFFGPYHAELTRSEAAADYVWKEETRVDGTQFEFGSKPIRRNAKHDWDAIWEAAKTGDLQAIPPSIRLQSYRTIRAIGADFAKPVGMERSCYVFWGRTGTGKSSLAWERAGMDAYPKDPRTKFWCGYGGQETVVIDEFRGGIDISHILRWLDRFPVIVEVKGGSVVLNARTIYVTSNISPREWYPGLDEETQNALLRRLIVTHFDALQ